MSQPATVFTPFSAETTFLAFGEIEGAMYAQCRRDYHPNLYQFILNRHVNTGGETESILDVGCGPGQAARHFASQSFRKVMGIDPSSGMIKTAHDMDEPFSNLLPKRIRFEISSVRIFGSESSYSIVSSRLEHFLTSLSSLKKQVVMLTPR